MHIRIIKMGGAAFTEKSKRETLHANFNILLSSLCSALALSEENKGEKGSSMGTVLIHGAGSFGHFDAKYGHPLSPSFFSPFLSLSSSPSFVNDSCMQKVQLAARNHASPQSRGDSINKAERHKTKWYLKHNTKRKRKKKKKRK